MNVKQGKRGLIAQLEEPPAHNRKVPGSNPGEPTRISPCNSLLRGNDSYTLHPLHRQGEEWQCTSEGCIFYSSLPPATGRPTVKTQLELLVRLQSCDSAILRAQRIQENHPREIKLLEEALEKEREAIRNQLKRFEEVKKRRVAREQDLALEEEKINKAKQRLTAVKTNKEYQAALKEIEILEGQTSKIEEEILTIMEEADALKINHDTREEQVKLREKEVEEKKRKLEKEIAECTQLIEEQQKTKEALLAQIASDVLDFYQRIKQKRAELTVVAAENSCCLGCHMNIPPQLFNEIKKCQKIIVCPHCSRILYWEKNHEAVSGALHPEPR